MSEPGDWPYERRPAGWQRLLLDRHADRAEWSVPAGRLGGVIRQLRRRAHIAHARSKIFLYAVFLTVGFGLVVYLGLPTLLTAIDGRRDALANTIASAERLLAEQDALRKRLREDLVAALKMSGEDLPAPQEVELVSSLRTLKLSDQTVLMYGSRGIVLRLDESSGLLAQMAPTDGVLASDYLGAIEMRGGDVR